MKPGLHLGVPMATYLATHAVSASLLAKINEQCPRAAWHDSWLNPKRVVDVGSAAQNAGTIAHSILLEGSTACVAVIDPNDYPTKTTGNIPDGWTNKDIRAARDRAIVAGKVPVLIGDMAQIEAMVDEARAYIESLREREPAIHASFQPGGGHSETTIVWEEDGGILCRIRPDRISTDGLVIIDYKTSGTVAEPDTWGRMQMTRMGYNQDAAFYRRGVKAIFGREPTYVFLVQEQTPPYLCSLVGLNPAWEDLGARKIARGLMTWSACMRTGAWPGYPARACYPELPPWEASRFEELELGGRPGIPYDPAKLWKKPDTRSEAERVFDALPDGDFRS